MAGTDKQKQSLYFPEDMLREIMSEANRLDRSLSWIVQNAWRLAREEVRKFPSVDSMHRAVEPRRDSAPPGLDAANDGDSNSQVREFLRGKFEKELTS